MSEEEGEEGNLYEFFARKGIQWRYTPPKASPMARVWERMVGRIKQLLSFTLGCAARFDYDIFQTTLVQIESVLN